MHELVDDMKKVKRILRKHVVGASSTSSSGTFEPCSAAAASLNAGMEPTEHTSSKDAGLNAGTEPTEHTSSKDAGLNAGTEPTEHASSQDAVADAGPASDPKSIQLDDQDQEEPGYIQVGSANIK